MRYAIYFTPPADDKLTRAAAGWLGRDAFAGAAQVKEVAGLSAQEHAALVAEPRRYGFHATLKAPFRLAESTNVEALAAGLEAFGRRSPAFVVPQIALARLGNFFALIPPAPSAALDEMAWQLVCEFDRFRAPLSEAELARRHPERLSTRQREYLEAWGYPYVREEFQFHMTLTGPVDPGEHARIAALLAREFGTLASEPLPIGQVALFVEDEPGAPFRVHSLYALEG